MPTNLLSPNETILYELLDFNDNELPMISHLDTCHKNSNDFYVHWHESLEFLYCLEGTTQITTNASTFQLAPKEIALINSNHLHDIQAISESSKYYCFILDTRLTEACGFDITSFTFQNHIADSVITTLFDEIISELTHQEELYKQQVKTLLTEVLVHLYRNYRFSDSLPTENAHKIQLVKDGISYIKQHYTEPLQIDLICQAIGISKFHFCRIFKEITNKTVLEYINILRCHQARQLILSGNYTISQSAEKIGFQNISYFSKCYQKHIGCLPSATKKQAMQAKRFS